MGHRIELGEIETAALKLSGVSRALCVYDADGKRIVLFYTGEPAQSEVSAALCAALPRYMLPSVIERLDAMPLTDNGKIDRRTLKERAAKI